MPVVAACARGARRATLVVGTLLVLLVLPAAAGAKVTVKVTADRVVLGNGIVERSWSRGSFRTIALTDRRGKDRTWSRDSRDFVLGVEGAELGSDRFSVEAVNVRRLPRGGRRVTMTLGGIPGLTVERVAEAYPGIAGFRMQTC